MRPTPAVVSPNGDGVDESPRLSYKLVRPSTVTVTTTGPDGVAAPAEPVAQLPGSFAVPFPPPPATAAVEGKWVVRVDAVDEIGQASSMTRVFRVDSTLGSLRVRSRIFVPPLGRDWPIIWTLTRDAKVKVTVETTGGTVIRTLALRRYAAGRQSVSWNGLGRDRKRVKGGTYVVRVAATGALGRSLLAKTTHVQQVPRPKR